MNAKRKQNPRKAKSIMANKVSRVMANKGNSQVLFCMNGNMVAPLLYRVTAYQ